MAKPQTKSQSLPGEMVGGALVKTVSVEPITGPAPEGETINVITIAPGVGSRGLVPVGTAMSIKPEAFSATWMRKV